MPLTLGMNNATDTWHANMCARPVVLFFRVLFLFGWFFKVFFLQISQTLEISNAFWQSSAGNSDIP